MKTFYIESRVTRVEFLEIKAESRAEALKAAENAEGRYWKRTHDEERQLVSIS